MQKLTRGLLLRSSSMAGYKNDGLHVLDPPSSAEPLNATLPEKVAKPSIATPKDTKHKMCGRMPAKWVPVVSKSGKPLTPCTPAKARKLFFGGVAKKRWSRLGVFHIQMLVETREETPKMCLGIDPGSKFDGYAIVSSKVVQQTGMSILPRLVKKKIDDKREMRRARRYRKTWRRPRRLDNRKRPEGWIAPSQKSKVDFRLRIVKELCKMYPVSCFAAEDVRFDHFTKKWGRLFSTVEVGKGRFYKALQELGELRKYSGFDTSELRESYSLAKNKRKSALVPETHATDALAISMDMVDCVSATIPSFYVWKRYEFHRRQLHKRQPSKSDVREKYGGSVLSSVLKKGDLISGTYKGGKVVGLACSYTKGYVGIATLTKSQRWIVPEYTVKRYYSNPIQSIAVAIHHRPE